MALNDTSNLKVDVPLTNFSLEQPQGMFSYDKMNLIVPVQKISDKIRVRSNDKFRLQDMVRTGKAASNSIDRTEGTPVIYSCDERAIHDFVLDRDADNADQPIMLMEECVSDLSSILNLDLEKNVADILTASASYGSNTSDPTNEWNDYTNGAPIEDIQLARKAIWDSSKTIPNYIVMGYETAMYLSNHPDIIDLMKYTRTEATTLSQGISLPSVIFGMNLVITGSSYNNANFGESESLAEVWGDEVALLHIGANTRNSYSAIKVFQYKDLMVRRMRVEDPQGDKIIVSRDYDVKNIACATAGYLLQNRLS